ncbi:MULTISPECIES: ATP-dependent DNA ligase LigA [Halolamina]|uniref:DNA ligase n=1 Tax=Halolamina pelagica TaxID=699431 RepID=A0A1I5VB87_9EURY|nr:MULTISPECIES: ATP-dependent DNA ligase LigA [Halolamina]NHX37708.1 ATP-dependent DNA ligase [Halolamina sp. R1-12]SFQ04824.1 DNA ligase-1 [Halolamina pelagica]
MQFAAFADRAAELEAEPADLETVALVADLLRDAGDDIGTVARFLQGRVFPGWDARTLDVGPALCYEALAKAAGTNVTADDVEERLADEGEIGTVAANLDLGGQQGLGAFAAGGDAGRDDPTLAEVDDELRAVAATEGDGSEDTKLATLFGLFSRVSDAEARYLVRLVLGEMRLGVGEGTVRDAIAEAFDVDPALVADALQVSNDYGRVARIARDEGEDGLRETSLTVGRPVQSMLAQAGTVTGALESWDEVAAEIKFDGARVQLHHHPDGIAPPDADREPAPDDPTVRLYSRNTSEVTDALPEIREFAEERLDAPAILDGEVVAVDDDGGPLPFQEVLRRFRRKHDVDRMREEVELELHAFDCLLDGRDGTAGTDLLDEPFRERHGHLADLLPEAASEVLYSDAAEAIEAFEQEALSAGHEGIMLKRPDSAYTPGDRGQDWLKRKPDVETLDCVVTGAEWGEGRRANEFGTFLLAVGGDDGYETVGKVATGITDERLAELTDLLEPHVVSEDGQTVEFRPEVVFEVGYEEIQASPTYGAGYALRFPRFVEVRQDKDPEDADTVERVERLANGGVDDGADADADDAAADGADHGEAPDSAAEN